MKRLQNPRNFLLLLNLLHAVGCATPSQIDSFRKLDGNLQDLYLRHYPDLSRSERAAFLEDADSRKQIMNHWMQRKGRQPSSLDAPILADLIIEPSNPGVISEGKELRLKSFAVYSDGRKIEVTDATDWKVHPPKLSKVHDGKLDIQCFAGDINVTATFLDNRETSQIYPIHKPIAALKITSLASYSPTFEYEYVKLNLLTSCADGTSSDVSCQAEWIVSPLLGTLSGCGYLAPSKAAFSKGQVKIRANYNHQLVEQEITLPSILPGEPN
jgi:hypothetical protein